MGNSERERAVESMKTPPQIETKTDALDALDRLALNASGWFSEGTLDKLTDARREIIMSHWSRGLMVLEEARTSMEAFVRALEGAGAEKKDALGRAKDELRQCVMVLSWLDQRPSDV